MKPNYYTIHKNKRPQRLFRKSKGKPNPFIAQIVLVCALGATHLSLTASKPIPEYKGNSKFKDGYKDINAIINFGKAEKELAVFSTLLNTTTAIVNLFKKANRFEFERLGHYTRKYKTNQQLENYQI